MKKINIGATTLSELRDALNAAHAALQEENFETGEDLRLEDILDLSSLPTFGGEEPGHTLGIWSWDEASVLMADGYSFYVAPRSE